MLYVMIHLIIIEERCVILMIELEENSKNLQILKTRLESIGESL